MNAELAEKGPKEALKRIIAKEKPRLRKIAAKLFEKMRRQASPGHPEHDSLTALPVSVVDP